MHRRGLFAQREPLLHAESMLLVDDNEPELRIVHLTLKQRVSADQNLAVARRDSLELLGAWLTLLFAAVPANLDTQGLEPLPKIYRMLFGENLGRCHKRNLIPSIDRTQRRQCGDYRFSRADVALKQTQHRRWSGEVITDLSERAALTAG